jgi:dephospho-CoA kinase
VKEAYRDPAIANELRNRWGSEVFHAEGQINRKAIAQKIFSDQSQRRWLEQLLHPWVARLRDKQMSQAVNNPQIPAFVWDTPLLCEAGLAGQCDALVYVETPFNIRLQRVGQSRGWDREELIRRENLQWPLDKKREISEYVVDNTADAEYARGQVNELLSRILARNSPQQA